MEGKMIPESWRVESAGWLWIDVVSTPDSSRSLTYYDNNISLAEALSQFYSTSPVLLMASLWSTDP